MDDTLNTQLNTAVETANVVIAEATQIITEDNTATAKSIADTGLNVMYAQTVNDFLQVKSPLVNMSFREATKPMVFETMYQEYFLPNAAVGNYNKAMDGIGIDTAIITQRASLGFGSKGGKDSVSRKQLMIKRNQLAALGQNYDTTGATVNLIEEMRRNAMNQLLRDFEVNTLWTGVASGGFGFVGLKTQHSKLNSTTTAAPAGGASDNAPTYTGGTPSADNSYEKTFWTNNTTGQDAWAADVFGRVNQAITYGVNHVSVMVANGSGLKAKNAMIKFQQANTQTIIQFTVGQTGIPTADGTYLSAFGSQGRYYVNDLIDVVESPALAAMEAMIYPDVLNGKYTIDNYEFVSGEAPSGFKTTVSVDDRKLLEYAGLEGMDEHLLTPLYTTANYHTLYVHVEWNGQIVYRAVPMSTLYSQVQFLTVSALTVLPNTNTTYATVDMMV
jgi:hypothetical protein